MTLLSKAVQHRTAVINAVIDALITGNSAADYAVELSTSAATAAGLGFRPSDFDGAIAYCRSQSVWLQRKLDDESDRIAREVRQPDFAHLRDKCAKSGARRANLRSQIAAYNAAVSTFSAAKAALKVSAATKVAVLVPEHQAPVRRSHDRRTQGDFKSAWLAGKTKIYG